MIVGILVIWGGDHQVVVWSSDL